MTTERGRGGIKRVLSLSLCLSTPLERLVESGKIHSGAHLNEPLERRRRREPGERTWTRARDRVVPGILDAW